MSAHAKQKHVHRTIGPPLPLYHPKGQLALSLPELDLAIFGISGSAVNIDDHDVRRHGSSQDADGPRSSSRARRPAAKLRDVGAGEEEESQDAVNAANSRKPNGLDQSNQPRSTSPRKRRTAGSSTAGGVGNKRRRREVDDGDGTYPHPAVRRSRNPRGVAAVVASPLAGPAVVAEANTQDGEGDADGDDGATVIGEPTAESQTARSTRSRRSRAPPAKRRGSSASETTTTSVSVSIAANARNTRSAAAKKPSDDEMPMDTDSLRPSQSAVETGPDGKAEEGAAHSAERARDVARTPSPREAQEGTPLDIGSLSTIADVAMKDPKSDPLPNDIVPRSTPPADTAEDPGVLVEAYKASATTALAPSSLTEVLSAKDTEEPSPATQPVNSDSKMDVDFPRTVVQPDVDVDTQSTHHSDPGPKSKDLPLKPPSPAIAAPVLPHPTQPKSSRPPIAAPPPAVQSHDDEKEEGELSDE